MKYYVALLKLLIGNDHNEKINWRVVITSVHPHVSLIIKVNHVSTVDLRDCDDKELLKEEDRKISKIKGISGMGRYIIICYMTEASERAFNT